MNRAVTFCAIALSLPVATYLVANGYTPTLSVLSGIHANNGLECTMDPNYKDISGLLPKGYKRYYDIVVWHIEFLPNNRFRIVDEKAANDIGTMTTTDTTYTFLDPIDWTNHSSIGKVLSGLRESSGLAVNRLTIKLYERYTDEYSEITITGWCTPAYVPPRPVPKKL